MDKKIEWLEVLFWIAIIVLFIMILTRIFGHSATDTQIYITIVTSMIAIMGYIMKMNEHVSKINREIGELKIKSINSFENIKNDMDLIKNKLKIK